MPLMILSAADNTSNNQESEIYETDVSFQNFSWGTSMEDVIKRMGNPVSREKNNGLDSLIWEGVIVNGYATYMLAYFSNNKLQGGTYYFLTYNMEEHMKCYSEMRQELRDKFGPTFLFDGMINELRAYQSSWNLPGGYIHLKVNTRLGEPVTLWYSSPELTKQMLGEI